MSKTDEQIIDECYSDEPNILIGEFDETIKAIISHYLKKFKPRLDFYLSHYHELEDEQLIRDGVHGIYIDETATEQRWYHQDTFVRFNGENPYNQMVNRLIKHKSDFTKRTTFEGIHSFIKAHAELINPFGELSIYDAALRISHNKKFMSPPEHIYLHSGAERGYKTLFNSSRTKVIGLRTFESISTELARLEPKYLEDILCIYKKTFWKLMNK